MSLEAGNTEPGVLATARYGKDKVRVFRVVRDPESNVHDVVEYNVIVLVEGAIETRCAQPSGASQCRVPSHSEMIFPSYTQADNSVVVATDSSASYSPTPASQVIDH
jgi:urate oxidase